MANVLFSASLTLVALSTAFWSIAAWLGCRARREFVRPVALEGPRPPLSLLIPVAGKEPGLADRVRSALAALRPHDELLVGAADASDPALDILRKALGGDPRASVVAGSAARGENRKVLALDAMFARSRHPLLVLADSDVRLDREALERLVSPLAWSPHVGLATALYRILPAGGLGSRLEAATVHSEFVCNVLAARALAGLGGIRFALGAANAVRRECVVEMGGFAALAGHLADDYELGRRVAAQGRGIVIAPCAVEILHASGVRETLSRLLRWARTYRVCRPWGYLGTALTHHGFTALLALILLAPGALARVLWPVGLLSAFVAARLGALLAAQRLLGVPFEVRTALLLPLRDLLGTALFVLAWAGNSVSWRGRRYRVLADGRLQRDNRRELLTRFAPRSIAQPAADAGDRRTQDGQ